MSPSREIHYTMGTLLDITVFDLPEVEARPLLRQCFQEARRLERLLSVHDPDSALSQLNQQAGHGPVQVPLELWRLLQGCAALAQRTCGAFDISAGSLKERWQAAPGGRPRDGTAAFTLASPGSVALVPGARLDLGGIGKGYAVDCLATLLRTARVHSALLNFGASSLSLLGAPPHGARWPIVIRGMGESDLVGLLWVKHGALSTSSSRRGERHTRHILDPRNDLRIDEPRLSTILAPSATLAEALSTAAVVRGAAWRALLAAFPEVEGLYVGPDRIPGVTEGLLEQFQAIVEGA